ncbi:MAG: hypothetical protein QOG38_837 [Hyphomicrobiales bacterium]|jgi:hypothetical protein|nr:hypothetical protein [Hyphomicrobiales bacterium]
MLRILAVLTAFSASPALAQTVDGPTIPRDQFDRINAFVGSSSELSGATQIRGLRPVKVNNALYYCGEASVGTSGSVPFYFDPVVGKGGSGIAAKEICGN